jgi:hypothetical protein
MVTAAIVSKIRSDEIFEVHDLTDDNTDVIGRLCTEAASFTDARFSASTGSGRKLKVCCETRPRGVKIHNARKDHNDVSQRKA